MPSSRFANRIRRNRPGKLGVTINGRLSMRGLSALVSTGVGRSRSAESTAHQANRGISVSESLPQCSLTRLDSPFSASPTETTSIENLRTRSTVSSSRPYERRLAGQVVGIVNLRNKVKKITRRKNEVKITPIRARYFSIDFSTSNLPTCKSPSALPPVCGGQSSGVGKDANGDQGRTRHAASWHVARTAPPAHRPLPESPGRCSSALCW